MGFLRVSMSPWWILVRKAQAKTSRTRVYAPHELCLNLEALHGLNQSRNGELLRLHMHRQSKLPQSS